MSPLNYTDQFTVKTERFSWLNALGVSASCPDFRSYARRIESSSRG
ncbi:hypothetical protein SSAG_06235 [Streptomyces sp. Mg1]|nr:hypothetical protein SSAG_06235 [Streptomyces sp. Mg1]